MNKLFENLYKHKILLLLIFIIWVATSMFQVYEHHFMCQITAKFEECGPLHNNMPVYYKGYKLGHIKKIKLSDDYEYTLVTIILHDRKPKMPENIIAQFVNRGVKEVYIELIDPDEPSDKMLKSGSVVEGLPPLDFIKILSEMLSSGAFDSIIEECSNFVASISNTSDEMGSFFSDSKVILKDNRRNIKHTTKSITEISSKLNDSISEEKLNNTITSLDKSSTNILSATENIKNITTKADTATKDIDKTMANIDSTISNVNATASNTKNITSGMCEVLSKRFAGLRIIFGKPLKNNACGGCKN